MAENIPNLPGGALPPKPSEAAKVQPKKETVRINLPPKPTAAPTIKLPTLPSGGPPPPTGAGAAPATSATVVLPTAAPKGPPVPTAGPSTRVAGAAPATTTAQRPAPAAAPAAASRAAAAQKVSAVSGLDKGLAFAAAFISLLALGCVIYLAFGVIQPIGGAN